MVFNPVAMQASQAASPSISMGGGAAALRGHLASILHFAAKTFRVLNVFLLHMFILLPCCRCYVGFLCHVVVVHHFLIRGSVNRLISSSVTEFNFRYRLMYRSSSAPRVPAMPFGVPRVDLYVLG